jgi:hypothetical protein
MEARRTGPLAVEVTLGGTADLALSAGLEDAGEDREGDEEEILLGGWCGVLVAVAVIIYGYWRGYVCVVRANQSFSLEMTLPAKK